MFIQGNPKALLVIGKKMNGSEFTDENLQFIEALGNTAISTLESERLFKEEIEKKKLENELNLALDIQKNLLPKNVPNVKYFEIHGISLPSRHVGGDYYDFIKLDENRTIVAIADVSGKGMPAALLMANVQAALRVIAPLGLPLREIVQRLNKIVYLNTSSDKFVTFFMGILESEHKTFEYINAGHNPPFILHSDLHIEHLTAGGLILGFMDDPFEYEQAVVKLEQDSVICMFTDGITEALNTSNLEYGDERLQELVRDIRKFPVEEMLKIIVEDVQQFAIGTQQFDDITLIGVKVI
jgi:sigma-B regulation protein RsbU (phosphoserine phosphatase)